MSTKTSDIVVLQTGKGKVLLASLLALLVAAVVLSVFILPAEFNRDPLGLGEALGIAGLSQPEAVSVGTVSKEAGVFHQDKVSFQLLPFEFVEYKYQLSKGSSMLYRWTATKSRSGEASAVSFDFHGESHEVEGYEESFSEGEGDHEGGTFIAPYEGIHGWFWANHGPEAVTVTLTTSGFYTESLAYRDGFVKKQIME
jgi:hypothetical protein